MRKPIHFFVFLLITFLYPVRLQAFQTNNWMEPYYKLVEPEFDQEAAFKTVAFVERRWRVVGNKGFNESIAYVVEQLKASGFVEESKASPDDRLIYRLEKRPLRDRTWEPVSASLKLASGEELLNFRTNRNMIAMRSFSTGKELQLEVVDAGGGRNLNLDGDLTGKLVFAETSVGHLFREAVQKRGAAGVLAFNLPGYLQGDKNVNSIQFSGIPSNTNKKSFGLLLSTQARNRLKAALAKGQNKVRVNVETKIYASEELTLVAELKGSRTPQERFVFSAHVQEPGANDNASGVGALGEVAVSSARLLKAGKIDPKRTITYLFGDEIVSTRRFIREDAERAKDIKWGMSLDMVGENTAITGGTFLIEKMPDPGAIWIRGIEKHSEWGGRPLSKEQLKPHYFNDLAIGVFKDIGKKKNWEVRFNPFEGGSDHVPFLRADIPGLLLWHFTDQFYHTDQDRLDKVSAETLKNVGTGALMIALMLTEDRPNMAIRLLEHVSAVGLARLEAEFDLSQSAVAQGHSDLAREKDILSTWSDYYQRVLPTIADLGTAGNEEFNKLMETQLEAFRKKTERLLKELGK